MPPESAFRVVSFPATSRITSSITSSSLARRMCSSLAPAGRSFPVKVPSRPWSFAPVRMLTRSSRGCRRRSSMISFTYVEYSKNAEAGAGHDLGRRRAVAGDHVVRPAVEALEVARARCRSSPR